MNRQRWSLNTDTTHHYFSGKITWLTPHLLCNVGPLCPWILVGLIWSQIWTGCKSSGNIWYNSVQVGLERKMPPAHMNREYVGTKLLWLACHWKNRLRSFYRILVGKLLQIMEAWKNRNGHHKSKQIDTSMYVKTIHTWMVISITVTCWTSCAVRTQKH